MFKCLKREITCTLMSRREDGGGGDYNRRRKSGNRKLHHVINYFLKVGANCLIFKARKIMKACFGRCVVLA